MTNTALATLSGNGALAKLSEADLIFQTEGAQYEDAFTFIPSQFTVAPGGGKSFVDKNGEMTAAPLTGIVFDSVKTRGYWPEKNGSKIPLCSSIGGVFGILNVTFTDSEFAAASKTRTPHPAIVAYTEQKPMADRWSCASCPMNVYGSAHQGGNSRGKGCTEKRRLLFLPDGWHMPIIINLPTMSVKGWDGYCSGLRSQHGLPFYAVKTTLKIEKKENADGQPYGECIPVMGERVTDPAMARAIVETQKQFRDLLRTLNVEADYESTPADEGSFVAAGETVSSDSASDVPF